MTLPKENQIRVWHPCLCASQLPVAAKKDSRLPAPSGSHLAASPHHLPPSLSSSQTSSLIVAWLLPLLSFLATQLILRLLSASPPPAGAALGVSSSALFCCHCACLTAGHWSFLPRPASRSLGPAVSSEGRREAGERAWERANALLRGIEGSLSS